MLESCFLRLFAWCWVVLVPLSTAAAAAPPERAAGPVEKAELRVFRLKYVAAQEASRLLHNVLGTAVGLRIAAEERTNSLLVQANRGKLAEIETLLTRLDVEDGSKDSPRPFVRIFPLNRIEPDEGLEKALELAFVGVPGKFTLDRRRRLVLALGDRSTMEAVDTLLAGLAVTEDQKLPSPDLDLQVRLYWVVNGPVPGAPGLPAEINEVAAELAGLGIDKPSLATQVSVSTALNAKFEVAGETDLPTPSSLSFMGNLAAVKDKLELQLAVRITPESRRGPRTAGSLRTQMTVVPGRTMVAGTLPTDARPSAFVVRVGPRVAAKTPPKPPGKAFSLEFRNQPWPAVFGWLGEQTGMPVVTVHRPTGTFTFAGPRGREYTLPELIDILNESLLAQNYLLIRRPKSFTVVPTDEKPDRVARAQVDDLDNFGNTEVVSVVFQLKSLDPETIAPEVKKLLGPFGDLAPMKTSRALVVQDTAGNLRRVRDLLEETESRVARPGGKK